MRPVISHGQLRLGQAHDDLVFYHFDAEDVWLGIHCVQPQPRCGGLGDDLIMGVASSQVTRLREHQIKILLQ